MKRWQIGIVGVIGAVLASIAPSYGQITIIPQSTIREAANPTIVEGSTICFDNNALISFGTIAEDSGCWQGEIEWHTTDGRKASITRITTSCNCLVADWERRANTATPNGKIGIKYYPKGHAGKVQQRLFVYTTLSADKPSAIVKIVGTVAASEDRSGDYAHEMGTLLLRQRSATLPASGGTFRIAVMNGGSSPLRITHDERMSLGGIKAHTEPATLQSGQQGDLVIEYKPTQEPVMLFLKGINAAPRERKIEIEIEK